MLPQPPTTNKLASEHAERDTRATNEARLSTEFHLQENARSERVEK
jgi:hypothetical protein